MTVDQMIEMLEDARDSGLGDARVLIATQPSWPLALTVSCVTLPDDPGHDLDESGDESESDADHYAGEQVIWIATGGHPSESSPYAPRRAWNGER